MAWTLFIVLLAGWAAGVVVGDSFGGALHLLLLGAVIMLFFGTLSSGRRQQHEARVLAMPKRRTPTQRTGKAA